MAAILLGIFYGSLADQYGRRPVLAMSLFGMSLGAAWIQVVCELSDYPLRHYSNLASSSILARSFTYQAYMALFSLLLTWRRYHCRDVYGFCSRLRYIK